jgi:hypothetical protein
MAASAQEVQSANRVKREKDTASCRRSPASIRCGRHEHAGHSHRYQLYRRNHPLTPVAPPGIHGLGPDGHQLHADHRYGAHQGNHSIAVVTPGGTARWSSAKSANAGMNVNGTNRAICPSTPVNRQSVQSETWKALRYPSPASRPCPKPKSGSNWTFNAAAPISGAPGTLTPLQ